MLDLKILIFIYYLGLFNDKHVSSSVIFKGDRAAGIFYMEPYPKLGGKGWLKLWSITPLIKPGMNDMISLFYRQVKWVIPCIKKLVLKNTTLQKFINLKILFNHHNINYIQFI